jgi:hypothetical protein
MGRRTEVTPPLSPDLKDEQGIPEAQVCIASYPEMCRTRGCTAWLDRS